MGNRNSRQTQQIPENLWITTASESIEQSLPLPQDAASSTPDDPSAPSSTRLDARSESREARQVRRQSKRDRKEQRRRIREARRACQTIGQNRLDQFGLPVHQGTVPKDHSPSTEPALLDSEVDGQEQHHQSLLVNMESNYAIDPNLQEAEGTVHTAPAASPTPGSDTNGAQAPVAQMNSSLLQDAAHYNMLPLIQAAEQAGRIQQSQYFTEEDSPAPAPSQPRQQGKGSHGGRGGKGTRGRPRKKKRVDDQNAVRDDEEQLRDSVDSVLGRQENDPPADGVDVEQPKKPATKSRKRRRKQADKNGEENEDDVEADQPNKKPRKAEVEVDETGLKPNEKELRVSGPLSKLEWRMIDEVLDGFKQEHDLNQSAVNDFVQSTNRAQSSLTRELWTRLYDTLHHRQHVAVMRACRRRFNNFEARGKWTTTEDDLLRQAYADSPGKWVKIGTALGRMPEDCRDRWRNYLSCGDSRRIDDWTTKEEEDLTRGVHECAEALKQEAKAKAKEEGHAFREQDWESYVNFNIVSEKMNFSRSRLQCYTHWKVMNNRDPSHHGSTRQSEGASNRQGRALANFRKMYPGDKYSILVLIADTNAEEDEEIPWKQIHRENPRSRWSTRDRKETFAKLKSELAADQPDLRSALVAMLEHFRTTYPKDLETMAPLVPDKKAKAQDEDLDGTEVEGGQPYYGEEFAEGQNQEPPGLGQGQAAVAQMRGAKSKEAKKGKKAGGKRAGKKAKQSAVAAEEQPADPGDAPEDSEAERQAAAEQLGALSDGTTLAQHLMAHNAAADQDLYDNRPYQDDEMDVDEAQAQATQAANEMQEQGQIEMSTGQTLTEYPEEGLDQGM